LLQTESVCLFATDSALVAGSNRCQVSYGNSMVAATRPPPDKIGVAIAALPHSNLFRDVATCVNLITESFWRRTSGGVFVCGVNTGNPAATPLTTVGGRRPASLCTEAAACTGPYDTVQESFSVHAFGDPVRSGYSIQDL
jgi:hypothetical protein